MIKGDGIYVEWCQTIVISTFDHGKSDALIPVKMPKQAFYNS